MQIRGLHRSIYRGARLSSRIEAKERSDEAKRSEEKRELVDRWLQARRNGLKAEAATRAVGRPRSTLARWHKRLLPRSTRPHTLRVPSHDPKLVAAVERLRRKHPMWGKDKLAPLLWREDFDVSVSKVGRILKKLVEDMPFAVEAIQVDGGSEFMAEFEAECARRDLKLYVLPPRTPELNGAVERCNGAWRYEFYPCTDLPGGVEDLNPLIDNWAETYNFIRPHGALSGLTPSEYLARQQAQEAPPPSHMS
jgi:transposase InsO family protein